MKITDAVLQRVQEILARGHDAEIRRTKDGYAVIEVIKKTHYISPKTE